MLPVTAMVRIFAFVLEDPTNEDWEQCCVCRRPYWWLFRGKVAADLQLVCARWMRIFKSVIVAPGPGDNMIVPVCTLPLECVEQYRSYLRMRLRHMRRIYFKTFPL